jgi:hypothetical protein
MFKKLFIMLLVGGLMVLGSKVWAADNAETNHCGWTNLKFAEFVAQQFGIKPPVEGTVHQRYEALASTLAQKGITYFSNTKANAQLTCCGAADALYAVVGAKEGAGSCDLKINYLVQNGIIKLPASGGDPCGALCNIPDVFSGVEKFSPPHQGPPPTNPPERHPENPSSRI